MGKSIGRLLGKSSGRARDVILQSGLILTKQRNSLIYKV